MSRENKNTTPATGAIIPISMICEETILDSMNYIDVQRHYSFKKVLGHGQFGTVREAIRIGERGERVAIKSVRKETIIQTLGLIKRELMIIRRLDHPNIVKFYETYEDAKYLHMVMELCEGGDLFDYVSSKDHLTEMEVSLIMRKLMHGVNHMHGMNICHRDLKPENFLYVSKAADADIKIVDFGMSTRFCAEENMTTIVGTPYYIAPEVIRGFYSKECDVWSLGVVMFFLLSGEQPFTSENVSDLYFRITNAHYSFTGDVWNKISGPAKDLVTVMLVPEASKRIPLDSALKHPWFYDNLTITPREVSGEVLSSIRRYKAPKRLQKEIIHLVVKYMSTEEISELKVRLTQNAFLAMDREKTGFITAGDLEQAMLHAGLSISNGEIKRIIDAIKCPVFNKIKYSDFLVAAFDRKRLMDEELLYLAFKRFDIVRERQDNDGYISSKDMRTSLFNLGSELNAAELELAMTEYDQNDDKMIDFDEFKRIVQQRDSDVLLSEHPGAKLRHKSMKIALSQVANSCA